MKTFKYKNYRNCYFRVSEYNNNPKAMAIIMENKKGFVTACTINHFLGVYKQNITTINNYNENEKMTSFLKKLGVVDKILETVNISQFPTSKLLIDICLINKEKLREYTKDWSYDV